jgi:hypothetical protein
MGANSWEYYTPFRRDVVTTLEGLQRQEFKAGRYHRSHLRHATIHQALLNSGSEGTRSILGMERISSAPDKGAVSTVPRDHLLAIFGTDCPTRQIVEQAFRIRTTRLWN